MLQSLTRSLALAVLVLSGLSAMGQKGTIRGTLIDGETGSPLYFANVVVKGTLIGTTADFDGNYEVQVEPGTHSLEISFIGYNTVNITDVKVKAGEVTVIDPVTLDISSNQLSEVVITVEATRNTEQAILVEKKNSPNVIDGISAAKLRKTGDSDAGDAAKRVTGVSVEGGKYVYVRGLGDRYTKTTLNGVDIPGLDPDRNAIQIDIFPTNLMSNMSVSKLALSENPADYTGGLVNIETKSLPEKPVFAISGGLGYTPSMHFNSDYIAYEGSSTDFLGFDNGDRELSEAGRNSPAPHPFFSGTSQEVADFNRSFNTNLGALKENSFMDYDLGLSAGSQKNLKSGNKLGYIFSATYKNTTRYYDKVVYGEYFRNGSPTIYDNDAATIQSGSLGERNVLLGGLAGVALKTTESKYRFTLMHLQNGESTASQLYVQNFDGIIGQSGYQAYANNLTYSQRALTNAMLSGEHHLQEGKWDIEWKISPTLSNITEPDLRRTAFTLQAGDSIFSAGQGGNPTRIWRYLDEVNSVERIDFILNSEAFGRESKLKFGASHVYKVRDYEILAFDLQSTGSGYRYDGDPNNVLTDPNLFPSGQLYYQSQNSPTGEPNPNEYSSNVNNIGAYTSYQFSPASRFKTIVGLRAEYYMQKHTGRDQAGARNAPGGNVLDNEVVLDALDLFPSATVIFSLNENQNLRVSYFRSIARPSFKELSFAQILDPVTNRTYNGGLLPYNDPANFNVWDGNLVSTRINNFDVRYEIFGERGELISVSAFAKFFNDPIELVRIPTAQTTPEFQPRNVGDGKVFGGEFEFRKSLAALTDALEKFSFSTNVTVVYSQIEMTDVEFNARKAFEKEGENVEATRAMAGQAPYIVNAGFQYDDIKKSFSAGIFYNVKGPTLEVVGGGIFPDVYAQPFHSLNLTVSKSFGKDDRSSINIKASNLLNDVRESFYVGHEAMDAIYSQYLPGTAFSIGYSYRFK
jgi:hypothetical protein